MQENVVRIGPEQYFLIPHADKDVFYRKFIGLLVIFTDIKFGGKIKLTDPISYTIRSKVPSPFLEIHLTAGVDYMGETRKNWTFGTRLKRLGPH